MAANSMRLAVLAACLSLLGCHKEAAPPDRRSYDAIALEMAVDAKISAEDKRVRGLMEKVGQIDADAIGHHSNQLAELERRVNRLEQQELDRESKESSGR